MRFRSSRAARKLVIETCADNARRVGMSRREFFASAMGTATSLWMANYIAACASSKTGAQRAARSTSGVSDATVMPGKNCVPREAMFDETCAKAILRKAGQFVFDIDTHWFDDTDLATDPAYRQSFGPLFDVATEDAYVKSILCDSDTVVACLCPFPGVTCTSSRKTGCGSPLSNERIRLSRDRINALAGSQRVLGHVLVQPQDPSGMDAQLEIMQQYFCEYGAAAVELYPGFEPGFRLDDDGARQVFERGLELGVTIFCVHKGPPIGNFDTTANYPDDVGPAAKRYPDAKLIVYGSAIFARRPPSPTGMALPEGPFDPTEQNPSGVNALVKSVLDAGLEPGAGMNVYGETGKAYSSLMDDPTQATHFFGKLMKYLGTDNVCWGTGTITGGTTTQQQIETFRALEIPADNPWGYPPLGGASAEGRANQDKILGLNAAALYGIDPDAKRCEPSTCG